MIRAWSRKIATLGAAAAIGALWVGVVEAGVILHEQEIVTQSGRHSHPLERVLQIEGAKEKLSDKRGIHEIVVDLTNNQTLIVHPASKDYFVQPFPPKGETTQWMVLPLATPPMLVYKATGKSSSALGYSCKEFSAEGEFNGARYAVQACFATTAPGADIYTAFMKKAAGQLASFAASGIDIPSGVPLLMRITHKGLKAPPATLAAMSTPAPKELAKKAPQPTSTPKPGDWVEIETRSTTVSSIEVTKEPIPDTQFVPKGFQAKQPKNLGF